jgi:hypothetical protein
MEISYSYVTANPLTVAASCAKMSGKEKQAQVTAALISSQALIMPFMSHSCSDSVRYVLRITTAAYIEQQHACWLAAMRRSDISYWRVLTVKRISFTTYGVCSAPTLLIRSANVTACPQ